MAVGRGADDVKPLPLWRRSAAKGGRDPAQTFDDCIAEDFTRPNGSYGAMMSGDDASGRMLRGALTSVDG